MKLTLIHVFLFLSDQLQLYSSLIYDFLNSFYSIICEFECFYDCFVFYKVIFYFLPWSFLVNAQCVRTCISGAIHPLVVETSINNNNTDLKTDTQGKDPGINKKLKITWQNKTWTGFHGWKKTLKNHELYFPLRCSRRTVWNVKLKYLYKYLSKCVFKFSTVSWSFGGLGVCGWNG